MGEVEGVDDEEVGHDDEERERHNSSCVIGWLHDGLRHRPQSSAARLESPPRIAIVHVCLGWSRQSKVQQADQSKDTKCV